MKAFYLDDETGKRVGYCYREGGRMVLVDTRCRVFKVSPKTTHREAIRILLSHQQYLA